MTGIPTATVADLNESYIFKMEDVLEVYERPYDAREPVVCLDEKPVTLHADVRPAAPAAPGREARRDNEYECCSTANVFCAVEPKAVRHFTFPTRGSLRLRIRTGALSFGPTIPRHRDDPFGDGQPQQSPTQVTD